MIKAKCMTNFMNSVTEGTTVTNGDWLNITRNSSNKRAAPVEIQYMQNGSKVPTYILITSLW